MKHIYRFDFCGCHGRVSGRNEVKSAPSSFEFRNVLVIDEPKWFGAILTARTIKWYFPFIAVALAYSLLLSYDISMVPNICKRKMYLQTSANNKPSRA